MKLRKKWICCVVTIIAVMMTFCFSACFSKKYSTADLPQTCTFTVQNEDGEIVWTNGVMRSQALYDKIKETNSTKVYLEMWLESDVEDEFDELITTAKENGETLTFYMNDWLIESTNTYECYLTKGLVWFHYGDGFDAQVGSLFDYEYAEMLAEGLNRCH